MCVPEPVKAPPGLGLTNVNNLERIVTKVEYETTSTDGPFSALS